MLTFLIVILYSLRLRTVISDCGDTIISSTTTYNCNSPRVFTQSSLPHMPVGGKDIYVQAEIKIEDSCSIPPPYHFLTFSIEPTTGTLIGLIDISWNGAQILSFYSRNGLFASLAYSVQMNEIQPADQWYSFTAWVKLGSNEASALFTYYGQEASAPSTGPVAYAPSWTIDKSPKLFVCSGLNGANSFKCQVANFKVWYESPTNIIQVRDGTTPKLIARYNLNQYNGYKVTDSSPNPLGPAYFGSSTASAEDSVPTHKPSWVPEEDPVSNKLMDYTGVVFDQSTQYITLPTFPLAKSLMSPAYSFTLKLWIKLLGVPSGIQKPYVFRYAPLDLTTNIFALQIQSNRKTRLTIYDVTTVSPAILSATDWNSVAITITSLDYMTLASPISPFSYSYGWLINNIAQNVGSVSYSSVSMNYAYDASNVVRLGGPPTATGIIAGVEIYSPGSNLITAPTSCQASSCLRDLGVTSPSTCLLPICATNCAACFNAQEDGCLACNTGYRLYQSKCVTMMCKPGKYLDSSNTCQNCMAGCETCNDGTSCDDCKTGFIKQGSVCTCPSGSVLDTTTNTCVRLDNGNPCNNPLNFYYPTENSCKSTCKYPFKIVSASPLQHCILDIDKEDAAQAGNVAKVSTTTSSVTNLGGAVIALLSSSNMGLLMIGSLAEMLSYIQYLKIDYPPKVYLMLYEQNINSGGLGIITEIPQEVADAIPNHPLPDEFAKNDTYSSFVANSWEFLISLCSIMLSIGVISLSLTCFQNYRSKLYLFLSKLLHSLRWNLFFGIFCSGYGFTGIFTALEFRTVNMDSVLSILSFVVSLVINTLGFWVLYFIVHLSLIFHTIQKTVRNPEDRTKQIEVAEEKWKSYEALFKDYKNDYLSQKIFLFIFMFRTYIHYSILGYLNDYPFLQTCCFTGISISILLYLVILRPMKSKMSYVQQMVCEIAIFIVNVCVLILSSMDKWVIEDYDTRVRVGDVIIAINLGLSIAGSVFMVIETLSQIKEAYFFIKSWLTRQKRTKNKFTVKSRNLRKSSKTFKPQHVFDTESKIKDLEISDLEKSDDLSMDQLKPQ